MGCPSTSIICLLLSASLCCCVYIYLELSEASAAVRALNTISRASRHAVIDDLSTD
jgi:hypothetical protein